MGVLGPPMRMKIVVSGGEFPGEPSGFAGQAPGLSAYSYGSNP